MPVLDDGTHRMRGRRGWPLPGDCWLDAIAVRGAFGRPVVRWMLTSPPVHADVAAALGHGGVSIEPVTREQARALLKLWRQRGDR